MPRALLRDVWRCAVIAARKHGLGTTGRTGEAAIGEGDSEITRCRVTVWRSNVSRVRVGISPTRVDVGANVLVELVLLHWRDECAQVGEQVHSAGLTCTSTSNSGQPGVAEQRLHVCAEHAQLLSCAVVLQNLRELAQLVGCQLLAQLQRVKVRRGTASADLGHVAVHHHRGIHGLHSRLINDADTHHMQRASTECACFSGSGGGDAACAVCESTNSPSVLAAFFMLASISRLGQIGR